MDAFELAVRAGDGLPWMAIVIASLGAFALVVTHHAVRERRRNAPLRPLALRAVRAVPESGDDVAIEGVLECDEPIAGLPDGTLVVLTSASSVLGADRTSIASRLAAGARIRLSDGAIALEGAIDCVAPVTGARDRLGALDPGLEVPVRDLAVVDLAVGERVLAHGRLARANGSRGYRETTGTLVPRDGAASITVARVPLRSAAFPVGRATALGLACGALAAVALLVASDGAGVDGDGFEPGLDDLAALVSLRRARYVMELRDALEGGPQSERKVAAAIALERNTRGCAATSELAARHGIWGPALEPCASDDAVASVARRLGRDDLGIASDRGVRARSADAAARWRTLGHRDGGGARAGPLALLEPPVEPRLFRLYDHIVSGEAEAARALAEELDDGMIHMAPCCGPGLEQLKLLNEALHGEPTSAIRSIEGSMLDARERALLVTIVDARGAQYASARIDRWLVGDRGQRTERERQVASVVRTASHGLGLEIARALAAGPEVSPALEIVLAIFARGAHADLAEHLRYRDRGLALDRSPYDLRVEAAHDRVLARLLRDRAWEAELDARIQRMDALREAE